MKCLTEISYFFFFGGATARGGPWPPLQYASRPLDPLLCLSIRLFPSLSGPWTRHPAISFLVFLFVLLHTAFRTISFFWELRCIAFFLCDQAIIGYLHHLPWLQHGLNVPCAKCQIRIPLSLSGIHYVPRLIVRFRNN